VVHSCTSFGTHRWADPAGERGHNRLVHHVLDVGRAHHPLVEHARGLEHLDDVHVLLEVAADQFVERVAGDGEDRLAVHPGVVEAVEEVHAAGAAGGHAHAQPAGELCVPAGGERGRLLVPHLDEAELVLAVAQRLEEPVDPSPGRLKIVSTPQSMRRSSRRSAAVVAMAVPRG
jgi:hypothetical protein